MGLEVNELNNICLAITNLEQEKKEFEKQAKHVQSLIDEQETKLMSLLEENGMETYISPSGRFTIASRETVKVPQDVADKKAFFDYLTERGVFYEYVTVNSQKLNGLYREERNEFKKKLDAGLVDGFDFKIPGLGEPSIHKYFHVSRSK